MRPNKETDELYDTHISVKVVHSIASCNLSLNIEIVACTLHKKKIYIYIRVQKYFKEDIKKKKENKIKKKKKVRER